MAFTTQKDVKCVLKKTFTSSHQGLTLCMLLLLSADFFFNINFSKNSVRNTIIVSNGLEPDQDRQNVGPDLGPNCLQRLSADDKSCR